MKLENNFQVSFVVVLCIHYIVNHSSLLSSMLHECIRANRKLHKNNYVPYFTDSIPQIVKEALRSERMGI